MSEFLQTKITLTEKSKIKKKTQHFVSEITNKYK